MFTWTSLEIRPAVYSTTQTFHFTARRAVNLIDLAQRPSKYSARPLSSVCSQSQRLPHMSMRLRVRPTRGLNSPRKHGARVADV